MENPNELVECYPEIMPGANRWVWGEGRRKEGQMAVTDDGLRHLLRMISKMQRALFDAVRVGTDAGEKPSKDGVRIPFKVAADLMNRTSQVFCEGELIVSGLFIGADGEPVISPSTEVPVLGSESEKAEDRPAAKE